MGPLPETPPVRLRTVVWTAVAVCAALWIGLATIEAKESEDARVRARVREFTDPAAGSARRELVVRELAGSDPGVTARVVREALLSDARRGAAAELAARLRLAGAFDLAKRWADGPAAPQIAALAMSAPEPAAGAWLAERWRAADPASDAFSEMESAMRAGRATAAVVAGLRSALADAARGDATLAILREQMGVDDACPSSLVERWPQAWERYQFEAREFPRGGDDLLSGPGWALGAARRVGWNLRLPTGGFVELASLPPIARVESGTLRLRLAAGEGRGAFVGLRTAGAAQELRIACDGRVWFMAEGPPRDGARVEVPFRPREWCEVEVRVTDPLLRDRPDVRDLRVFVDGAEMRPSGGFWRLASPPQGLVVGAATRGAEESAPGPSVPQAPNAVAPPTAPGTCLGGVTWTRAR